MNKESFIANSLKITIHFNFIMDHSKQQCKSSSLYFIQNY